MTSHLSQVGVGNISTLPPNVSGGASNSLNHPYGSSPSLGSGLGAGAGTMHANSINSASNSKDLHMLQSVHTLGSNSGGGGGAAGGGGGGSIGSPQGGSNSTAGSVGDSSRVGHDLDYGFGQGFAGTTTGVGGVAVGVGGWGGGLSGVNSKSNTGPHDVMEQYQSPSLSQEERFNMLLHQMKQHDGADMAPPGGGAGLGLGGSAQSPSQNNNGRGSHFDPLKWINYE